MTTPREAEYQRLVAITESRDTTFEEYKRAMQAMHDLLMEGLTFPLNTGNLDSMAEKKKSSTTKKTGTKQTTDTGNLGKKPASTPDDSGPVLPKDSPYAS